MSDDKPTILVTNVTVENITVSPGIAIDASLQTAREIVGRAFGALTSRFRN